MGLKTDIRKYGYWRDLFTGKTQFINHYLVYYPNGQIRAYEISSYGVSKKLKRYYLTQFINDFYEVIKNPKQGYKYEVIPIETYYQFKNIEESIENVEKSTSD